MLLREVRHELFDASFEAALAKAYKKPRGTALLPPALLAMVTLLQAYDQVGGHCQRIEKIPKKWVKHWTTDLLTSYLFVNECQGKSQEIGYLPLS